MFTLSKEFEWGNLSMDHKNMNSHTNADILSRVQIISVRLLLVDFLLHFSGIAVRGITGTPYPLFFNAWLPLDVTELPGYIIMFTMQVCVRSRKKLHNGTELHF